MNGNRRDQTAVGPTNLGSGICIVLAVRNGAKYLPEQLASYKRQSLPPRWVIVGDDGSTDGSVAMIRDFFKDWTACELIVLDGPQRGYAANFCALLGNVPKEAQFVALSDQDDVWLETKLERAVQQLSDPALDLVPCLYGAATWVCDDTLSGRRLSRLAAVGLGFEHALVQNFAGGNTMVLNRASIQVIRQALGSVKDVPVHDWWIYQMVTATGGQVIFDRQPSVLYRQHGNNAIGANGGVMAAFRRVFAMLRGTYRSWNSANLAALAACEGFLAPTARSMITDIILARSGSYVDRIGVMIRHRLRRQGFVGQSGLWVSLLLNKF